MRQVIEWLGSDDLLMFASDYPHLHADDIDTLLAVMPEAMRANVMAGTARRWYRL
jgi:predicted TIM-barrel fold metal-dependent hydrolase